MEIDQPLSNSDHYAIILRLCFEHTLKEKVYYDFSKCSKVKSFLTHINWNIVFQNCDHPNSYWLEFSKVINHGIENCLTKKTNFNGTKPLFPLSEGTRKSLLAKKRVWTEFRKTHLQSLKSDHHKLSKLCKRLVFRDRISFENRLSEDGSDTKKFFSYVKSALLFLLLFLPLGLLLMSLKRNVSFLAIILVLFSLTII